MPKKIANRTLGKKVKFIEPVLGPDRFVCYRFYCTNCPAPIEFVLGKSECFCPEDPKQPKTRHMRGLCKKCTKKSKKV